MEVVTTWQVIVLRILIMLKKLVGVVSLQGCKIRNPLIRVLEDPIGSATPPNLLEDPSKK